MLHEQIEIFGCKWMGKQIAFSWKQELLIYRVHRARLTPQLRPYQISNLKGLDANQSAFLLLPISLSPTFQNPLFYHCAEGALVLFRRVGAASDS